MGPGKPQNCRNSLPVKSKVADGAQIGQIEITRTPQRIVQFC